MALNNFSDYWFKNQIKVFLSPAFCYSEGIMNRDRILNCNPVELTIIIDSLIISPCHKEQWWFLIIPRSGSDSSTYIKQPLSILKFSTMIEEICDIYYYQQIEVYYDVKSSQVVSGRIVYEIFIWINKF